MSTRIPKPRCSLFPRLARGSLAAWCCSLLVAGAQPAEPEKPDAEEKPAKDAKAAGEFKPLGPGEYNNWLDLSVGGFFVDGDKAQMQRRLGLPAGPFGGVEDFHVERPFQKKGLFSIDGRGIFDNHDYLLKLNLSYPERWYVQMGYREFRMWYDGSGGFFPLGTNHWFSLYNDEMHIDRGEVWFETGLRIPEAPEITFRYAHDFRDGNKDSTSWGDTGLLGLPAPNNIRGIVPSFWDIDERRDTFLLDLEYGISSTDLGVGVRYELVHNNDSRNIRRRPGEASDRFLTQKEELDSDLFNAHASTETRFNDNVLFTTGYSFTTLDTDVGGSRIYGADYDAVYDPLFARRQFRDEGFLDLSGGAQAKQYVFNANLMFTAWDSVALVPSLRFEHWDQSGLADFIETDVGAPPALAAIETDMRNFSDRDFTDVSEALELRYTGLTNWLFYVRGEWLEGEGDLRETQAETDPDAPPAVIIVRDTDSTRLTQKYVAGANWYPMRRLNLAGQYYHKIKRNDYTHHLDSTTNAPPSPNRYPAYLVDQDFETDDVNFRVTFRPLNNLTLISRYDFQYSIIDTKAAFLAKVQSGRTTSHILSQSISWAPLLWLYLQGNVNYTLDKTETPANDFPGSGTNTIVRASSNNYWNASLLAGLALDDRTELQAQYFYYRANNYYATDANFTQPYGAGDEEHGVLVSIARQLTARMRLKVGYGFFSNRDQTSGGHNDYNAHLLYSSLQYRF